MQCGGNEENSRSISIISLSEAAIQYGSYGCWWVSFTHNLYYLTMQISQSNLCKLWCSICRTYKYPITLSAWPRKHHSDNWRTGAMQACLVGTDPISPFPCSKPTPGDRKYHKCVNWKKAGKGWTFGNASNNAQSTVISKSVFFDSVTLLHTSFSLIIQEVTRIFIFSNPFEKGILIVFLSYQQVKSIK